MSEKAKRVTPNRLLSMKRDGVKITMVTAYDYPTAKLLDRAGIDLLLVGDSLGMVVQGRETTLSVTLDEMIYHTEMVARGASRAMAVADLPFPCAQLGPTEAVRAGSRLLKETLSRAVKVEGGRNRANVLRAMTEAGIPVIGHCGLMPQSIRQLGGYRIERNKEILFDDIRAVEESGAMAVVLECVPRELAAEISAEIKIPTIGIGAGNGCDGQVLVFHDLMGYALPEQTTPKHARCYDQLSLRIIDAASRFADDVRAGRFPSEDESFSE